jgi:hypothetical protein
VYFGPLGLHCRALTAYLEALPGVPRCPVGANPAGWMLDVLSSAAGAHHHATGAAAEGSAKTLGEATPLLMSPLPRWTGLPSGEEFQAAFFSSGAWVARESSAGGLEERLQQLCASSTSGATAVQGGEKKSGAGRSSSGVGFLAQLAPLVAREWRSAYRDLPYNMGRILALVGLQVRAHEGRRGRMLLSIAVLQYLRPLRAHAR